MTSKLPEGWEEVSLGEVINFRRGHDLTRKNMNEDGQYNVIGSNGPIGKHDKYILDGPVVTIGRSGNVGAPYYNKDAAWPHNTTLYIDDFKGNNPMFLFYKLATLGLHNFKGGSAVPTLNRNHIHPLKTSFPPLREQEEIAATLSALDDKIENNNRINKNLEAQAQALFQHWFVDFEFPDENGNPYKSSGGEMVESELGLIPKGWKVKKIKDISKDIVLGKTPPTSDKENFGQDIPFLTIPDMHNKVYVDFTERMLSKKGESTQSNKTVPENSICVSCIATPGLVVIAREPTQTNQQINTIIPNIEYTYVYSYLKNISSQIIQLGSGGTATNNLNKTQFSNIDFLLPDKIHLKNYQSIVETLFNNIRELQIQNQKLAQLRDTLLPKLMSGELRIPLDN